MQIIRTIVWVLITVILVSFIAMNWAKAPVNFWPLDGNYLHFEWPVGIIALLFFLLGLIPMWLLHRAGRWRFQRQISSLENSVRAAAAVAPTPAIPSTQPEATEQEETAS